MAASGHTVIDFQYSYADQSHYTSGKKAHTILDKLQKYQSIPQEIRNHADVIYNKMTVKQHRKTKLVQLLYWCCYNAYLEMNLDVTPQALGGGVFGLTNTEIARCGTLFSPLETGYYPPKVLHTPLNYLPGFCGKLPMLSSAATEQCLKLADRIISKQPSLIHDFPLNVAAGILKYYLIINGISFDITDLETVVGVTDSTITPWYKLVESIDNTSTSIVQGQQQVAPGQKLEHKSEFTQGQVIPSSDLRGVNLSEGSSLVAEPMVFGAPYVSPSFSFVMSPGSPGPVFNFV